MKEILCNLRDAIAYSFTWLVICVIAATLCGGNETIRVSFLLKLLALCAWGAISLVVSFRIPKIRNKGFMFSLTCFYVLFLPVEIILFYAMGIFQGSGNLILWLLFAGIIVATYVISLLIDVMIMKRRAIIYTSKLEEYKKR